MTTASGLLDASDSVLLLVDHQSGLLQVVQDIAQPELRVNLASLAKAAELSGVPVITTASVPDGPNGPLLPEVFDNAPNALYVARQGEIDAWDVQAFRDAVRETGRRTVVVAGIITNVCVVEPSLSALADGYTVHAVINASGTYSDGAQRAAVDRMSRAGVVITDVEGVLSEWQHTWNRPDALDWAGLHAAVMPAYAALIQSVARAQAEVLDAEGARTELKHARQPAGA
ncbi:MAG TPA: isochorismatase family protein [Trebonia sp.]|jgi:nicotinamidase-related amidase|nr:isochorismatase family protein [Trebonia sp.]